MSYSELTEEAQISDQRDEIEAAVTAFNDAWGGDAGFNAAVTGSLTADDLQVVVEHDILTTPLASFTYDNFTAWAESMEDALV